MKAGHTPIRTCIGCRRKKPKGQLIRLAARDGQLAVCRQGGRGLYVCPDASCLAEARKRRAVTKSLDPPGKRVSAENGLDWAGLERVICGDSSGGAALG